MARSSWPSRKVGITLLPSGEQGDALLSLAREWTRMGLLGAGLWIRPELVERSESAPPRIKAIVLGLSREHRLVDVEVDLFETLARQQLSLVRLVKLRSATPSREIDAEQDSIANHLDEYLSKSMPMALPSAAIVDQASELVRITLICAPTEFQLRERVDWASSDYGTVIVASPEDRSSPWSGDAFVRDNERFVGFALMHLVSAAGLWNGADTGTLELMPPGNGNSQGVLVSRVFVNAVITEALGRRTAAAVLESAAQAESLLVDASAGQPPHGTAFIDDSSVSDYTKAMVSSAMSLDNGALTFHPTRDDSYRAPSKIGIGEQLSSFAQFSFDKLRSMPKWSWRWVTSKTARSLTESLQSPQGMYVVAAQYEEAVDARDQDIIRRRDDLFAAVERTREVFSSPAGLSELRTTPQLWAHLRELVFSSLDGSADLSSSGFKPIEGRAPVFRRVSDVFPDPALEWSVADSPDSLKPSVNWQRLAISDPRDDLLSWIEESTAEVRQHSAALRSLQRDMGRGEEPEVDEEPDVDDEPGVAESQPGPDSDQAHDEADETASVAPLPDDGDAKSADDNAATEPEEVAQPVDAPKRARTRTGSRRAEAPEPFDKRLRLAELRLTVAEREQERRNDVLRHYDEWAEPQSRSFVWTFLSRLAKERSRTDAELRRLDREIEAVVVPEPGTLLRLRRSFHRSMLVTWLIIAAITTFAVMLPRFFEPLQEAIAERDFWYPEAFPIIATGAVIAVALTVTFLAKYHREWSRFQREVNLSHDRLRYIGDASIRAKRESKRLASVHAQTVEWLELLARAIREPWQIKDEWKGRPEYVVARDSMPFSMNVASVVENDHASTTRLRRITTEHLMRRGWRAEAFRELIQVIGAELGHDAEAFGVSTLDEDLPHASNHSRAMLRDNMSRPSILAQVAQPRLRALMAEIQSHALHGSKPPVMSINEDPLSILDAGLDSDPADAGIPWDDFLIDSLATRTDPVPPLSTSWLTERSVQDGHHESVTSYLVLPRRLSEKLHFRPDAPIHPSAASGAESGIDLVLRIDMVGPLPVNSIALWDVKPTRRAKPDTSASADLGI